MTDHPIPSGPEDSPPGCTVGLTKAQLARVQELDPSHTVELERRGDAWIRLRVFSPDGEIFQEADVPPA